MSEVIPNEVISTIVSDTGIATNKQPTLAQIEKSELERIEADFLKRPQVECPLKHQFAPGVYLREIEMPVNTFIIGHEHKTKHFNIVLSGRASVIINGELLDIVAPCIFVSEPGVRKVLYIRETMRWLTVHPTDETDIDKLEDMMIVRSEAFMAHKELETLQNKLKQ
ncbi:MAG: hypothetical protein JW388_0960 [Nitrospira sp.]|nr:hypothetical protein [Nitrospira sp.]